MIEYNKYEGIHGDYVEYKDINYLRTRIIIRHVWIYNFYYVRYINSRLVGIKIIKILKDEE
jgi:hypothetical protein